MKIVAILGGLGSQMFKYSIYRLLKEQHPLDCYIDTSYFWTAHPWNGYELARIFDIREPDITEKVSQKGLEALLVKNRPYRDVALRIVKKISPCKERYIITNGQPEKWVIVKGTLWHLKQILKKILLHIQCTRKILEKKKPMPAPVVFDGFFEHEYNAAVWSLPGVVYFDEFAHCSDKYFRAIKEDIVSTFHFPDFSDPMNITTANDMQGAEAVAIHLRRSDHMYDCASLYENGYYQRSINYIKKNTLKPTFYIFSEDMPWCKGHLEEIGFSPLDRIVFVDWNQGKDSFRDMQLMTYCQHNIISVSSFGWWGYYLSRREQKLVCAPLGCWHEVPSHL